VGRHVIVGGGTLPMSCLLSRTKNEYESQCGMLTVPSANGA